MKIRINKRKVQEIHLGDDQGARAGRSRFAGERTDPFVIDADDITVPVLTERIENIIPPAFDQIIFEIQTAVKSSHAEDTLGKYIKQFGFRHTPLRPKHLRGFFGKWVEKHLEGPFNQAETDRRMAQKDPFALETPEERAKKDAWLDGMDKINALRRAVGGSNLAKDMKFMRQDEEAFEQAKNGAYQEAGSGEPWILLGRNIKSKTKAIKKFFKKNPEFEKYQKGLMEAVETGWNQKQQVLWRQISNNFTPIIAFLNERERAYTKLDAILKQGGGEIRNQFDEVSALDAFGYAKRFARNYTRYKNFMKSGDCDPDGPGLHSDLQNPCIVKRYETKGKRQFFWFNRASNACALAGEEMANCGTANENDSVLFMLQSHEPEHEEPFETAKWHIMLEWNPRKKQIIQILGFANSFPDERWWEKIKDFYEDMGSPSFASEVWNHMKDKEKLTTETLNKFYDYIGYINPMAKKEQQLNNGPENSAELTQWLSTGFYNWKAIGGEMNPEAVRRQALSNRLSSYSIEVGGREWLEGGSVKFFLNMKTAAVFDFKSLKLAWEGGDPSAKYIDYEERGKKVNVIENTIKQSLNEIIWTRPGFLRNFKPRSGVVDFNHFRFRVVRSRYRRLPSNNGEDKGWIQWNAIITIKPHWWLEESSHPNQLGKLTTDGVDNLHKLIMAFREAFSLEKQEHLVNRVIINRLLNGHRPPLAGTQVSYDSEPEEGTPDAEWRAGMPTPGAGGEAQTGHDLESREDQLRRAIQRLEAHPERIEPGATLHAIYSRMTSELEDLTGNDQNLQEARNIVRQILGEKKSGGVAVRIMENNPIQRTAPHWVKDKTHPRTEWDDFKYVQARDPDEPEEFEHERSGVRETEHIMIPPEIQQLWDPDDTYNFYSEFGQWYNRHRAKKGKAPARITQMWSPNGPVEYQGEDKAIVWARVESKDLQHNKPMPAGSKDPSGYGKGWDFEELEERISRNVKIRINEGELINFQTGQETTEDEHYLDFLDEKFPFMDVEDPQQVAALEAILNDAVKSNKSVEQVHKKLVEIGLEPNPQGGSGGQATWARFEEIADVMNSHYFTPIGSLNEGPQTVTKLRIFDFDETIAFTTAHIYIKTPQGEELSPMDQTAFDGFLTKMKKGVEELQAEDWEFNFDEYLTVNNPQLNEKVFEHVKRIINKNSQDRTRAVYVMTAREARSRKPIEEYLNELGFSVGSGKDFEEVITLEGSSKKDAIIKLINQWKAIESVAFFDDSDRNIDDVMALRSLYPEMDIQINHVVHGEPNPMQEGKEMIKIRINENKIKEWRSDDGDDCNPKRQQGCAPETWRQSTSESKQKLNEEELPQAEQSKFSPQQIEALRQFAKEVIIVTQAIEDTAPSNEGKASMRARQKKNRIKRTKEIKNRAGLVGVKLKDFTPEQKRLYNVAKQELAQDEEAGQMMTLVNIQHGDLLDIPIIKDIVNAHGGGFKKFITAIASGLAGNPACAEQNKLTIDCVLGILSAEATG